MSDKTTEQDEPCVRVQPGVSTRSTTGRYRKKPVVIEAFQFTEDLAIRALIDREPLPFGLSASGSYHPERRKVYDASIQIPTREGVMRADIGDWIIKEPFPTDDRRFYPCKPDSFQATYESIE